MIKVCHIISGDLWAGAEVMDFHLLKYLKKFEQLDISAILFNEGRLANEIRSLDIPVDVVDETRSGIFQLVRHTGKILRKNSPDVIHSHRYKENIVSFLSSKYQNNIQLVSTQHGMPEYIGPNRNKKYYLLHKLNILLQAKAFRKVIAVSHDLREILINSFGFAGNKIIVIRNGTEIPSVLPRKMEKKFFVIGSMGRMFPVKDYPLMVEIAREIYKETDKIRFELAGDGPDKEKLQHLIERYRLGDVFLLRGFVENLFDFYSGLDLYINTSLHEGIPMSVLDAMSYGIPIIALDVGGLKEVMSDGNEGFLISERDPKIIARKCLHLYSNGLLRKSMASSAREKVEKEFSNVRMAKEYYQLYIDIIDRRKN